MKTNNIIKRIGTLILAMVITITIVPYSISATTVVDRLQYDNQYYIYSGDEYDLGTTLEKSGHMTFVITGIVEASIYDSNSVQVANIWTSGEETVTWNVDLISGKYKILVEAKDTSGTFKVSYKEAPETVITESTDSKNNSDEFATPITTGLNVKGQLAVNDDKDIYQLKLKKNGNLSIKVKSSIATNGIRVHVYQTNGKNSKYSKALKSGSSTVKFKKLKKGTYYVAIEAQNTNNDTYTGTYSFKTSFKASK